MRKELVESIKRYGLEIPHEGVTKLNIGSLEKSYFPNLRQELNTIFEAHGKGQSGRAEVMKHLAGLLEVELDEITINGLFSPDANFNEGGNIRIFISEHAILKAGVRASYWER